MASPAQETTALPGISSLIQDVNSRLASFASTDSPVLISGEPGTEKAFAAKIVHLLSGRASQPLFKLSVSYKLPPDLAGRFMQSNGGTLIINLQRDFPVDMQYTLLEMITDRSFSDPLSGQVVEADVRLILTAVHDLDHIRSEQQILPELLSVLEDNQVVIPPIRERPEDIPALVRYATRRARQTGRSNARGADAQVLALFRRWEWPGNAEDLLLITAEAALDTGHELIRLDDLPEGFLESVPDDLLEQARTVRLPGRAPAAVTPSPAEAPAALEGDPANLEEALREAEEVLLEVSADAAAAKKKVEASDAGNETREETAKSADQVDREARRLQRLITLARRLNTQSQMLARQMSGPLDRRLVNPEALAAAGGNVADELASALESEIDRGLDAILALRRQMAKLNQREKQSILTARDLYRRLLLASHTGESRILLEDEDIRSETSELAESLRDMDSIIQHVSGSFPKLTEEDEDEPNPDTISQIHEEEARAIEETLRRAARTRSDLDVEVEEDVRVVPQTAEEDLEDVAITPPEETPGDVTTAEEPDEDQSVALPPAPPASDRSDEDTGPSEADATQRVNYEHLQEASIVSSDALPDPANEDTAEKPDPSKEETAEQTGGVEFGGLPEPPPDRTREENEDTATGTPARQDSTRPLEYDEEEEEQTEATQAWMNALQAALGDTQAPELNKADTRPAEDSAEDTTGLDFESILDEVLGSDDEETAAAARPEADEETETEAFGDEFRRMIEDALSEEEEKPSN